MPDLRPVVMLRYMKVPEPVRIVHLRAELTGVTPARLRDRALIGGLLIAAAGAAGLHANHAPILQVDEFRGVDGLLMLEAGHAAVHCFASQRILLLDILVPEPANLDTAVAVFTRRLSPTGVAAERAQRIGPVA